MGEPASGGAIPVPNRVFNVAMDDGAVIRVRRHGNQDGPRLVMSHGNGLAIDGYLPFWSLLCDRYEVVLFDFRNHGRNPLHGVSGHNWRTFIGDFERLSQAIAENLGSKRTAGVFHSLSAVTALLHSVEMGRRFDALVLFDPPIYPSDGHPLQPVQRADKSRMAARARRRTERYKHPRDFARQLASLPPFRRWVPEAYELMAEATLRHDPASGDWILACPRELEARVFESNSDPTLWSRIATCPVPLKLICADPGLEEVSAPTLVARALAAELGLEYEAIPDTTHFLQIERPPECVRALEAFLAKHGIVARASRSRVSRASA